MKLVKGYRNIAGGFSPPIGGLGAHPGAYRGTPSPSGFDVPPEYAGDPVFLSANATVDPKATASPNNEALRNPYDFPIEIDEIRFTAWGLQNISWRGYGSPGPQLGVSLALGDLPVTKNYVPIYAMCPGAQVNNESNPIIYSTSAYPGFYACHYRLALETPLILKPRELLEAHFENVGLVAGSNSILGLQPGVTTMFIGYLGRTRRDLANAMPATRTVPYFAAWAPQQALVQPASGPANTSQSAETDLMNQSGSPIRLSRFIGRLASQILSAGYGVTVPTLTELIDTNMVYNPGAVPAQEAVQIMMTRSNGTPVIAPGTPFRLVFDGLTRSWNVEEAGLILEPNDYLSATLSIVAPDAGIDLQTPQMLAAVGMTGYREVSL